MFWLIIFLAWILIGFATIKSIAKDALNESNLEGVQYVYAFIAFAIVIVGWPIFWARVAYLVTKKSDSPTP